MAIFTATELDEQITAWKAALLAVATGQEYVIGIRRLRRADLSEIRETLTFFEAEKAKLEDEASQSVYGSRRAYATPRSDTW